MFAYVRFRDDNEKRIVPVAACKHLKPNDTSDFNPRKWYKVFWKDETHCDHYHAQVIRPYATEDDAGKATEKRTSIPQRPGSDSSYSCSSNEVDGSFEERQAAVKQKMKDVSSHFKKKQRDLLFGDAEGGKKTEKELLKEEVNMLKAENSKLLDRIRMLEKALCSKIFKTEKKTSFCARAAAASQNNKLRLCHRHVLPRTTTMQPPRTATVQPLRTTTATPGSPEVAHTSAREADYVTTDGEVHLGKGITIPEGLYSRLMSTKSETRFVREAAVAIYSTAGLVGRSVIGTASNRTKGEAKPPLDKEKYAVLSDFFNHFLKSNFPIGEVEQKKKILNKALANKINDLMKSKD
ncbi:uncharacterized protein LOC119406036 isoform X2 [Rhipicephalus sanguineus]|uniref:uncharacterized protein LOC119406036 isoform X2 n=1 Tax=Rhipicephalus sanguineus TaxID=34632 RepID=UPI00189576B4|nr:uncharacterized protein LOC119406036 isoform X2 [Rhipicephalus sanguineus]